METNKSVIIALSLSVLLLAAVSTFLSLRQSGVLGISTSIDSKKVVAKPSTVPTPAVASKLCGEVQNLYKNHCLTDDVVALKKEIEPPKDDSSNTTTTGKTVVTGRNRVCGDLFKLTEHFCPTVTTPEREKPETSCKYGINSFAVDQRCSNKIGTINGEELFTSAKYSCYDGTTSVITSAACVTEKELRTKAKEACLGHGSCKNPQVTPVAGKHCTGDKDCKDTEYCLIRPNMELGTKYEFGKCVPKNDEPPTRTVTKTVTRTTTVTALKCGWCGNTCTYLRPNMDCAAMAPPAGKSCVNQSGTCKVVNTNTVETQRGKSPVTQ